MHLLSFFAVLLLPTLAACTQEPFMAPVMIANPLLVEENIHTAETNRTTATETIGSAAKAAPVTDKTADGKHYYLVKPGDSLSTVANAFAKDAKLLAEWNQLPPPYQINAGQKLMLFAPEQPSGSNIPPNNPVETTPTAMAEKSTANAQHTAVKNSLDKQPAKALPAATKTATQNGNPPQVANSLIKAQPTPDKTGSRTDNNKKALTPLEQTTSELKSQSPPSPEHKGKPANPIKNKESNLLSPDKSIAKTSNVSGQKKPAVSNENKKVLKLDFQWPVHGTISKDFSHSHGKGIDITTKADKQSVNAAESGKVVYQGQGLNGFKNLIIIKHNDGYLTAYANNSRLLVKEGQDVSKGQVIAEIGTMGNKQKTLHFEIRKNGDPINPIDYLPK